MERQRENNTAPGCHRNEYAYFEQKRAFEQKPAVERNPSYEPVRISANTALFYRQLALSQQLCKAPWEKRHGLRLAALPTGTLILTGGFQENREYLADCWRSKDGGNTWVQSAACPWLGRAAHGLLPLLSGGLLLFAGLGHGQKALADAWISHDEGEEWDQLGSEEEPLCWRPRFNFGYVLAGTDLVIAGGAGDKGEVFNDVFASYDNGFSWQRVCAEAPWCPRRCHGMAVTPSKSLLLAGGCSEERQRLADCWVSRDLGASWALLKEKAPWGPRAGLNLVAVPGGRILVFGGQCGETGPEDKKSNDMWASLDGKAWTCTAARLLFEPRRSCGLAILPQGSLVIAGGWGDNDSRLNDCWVMQLMQ